jgi:hypothetical protein
LISLALLLLLADPAGALDFCLGHRLAQRSESVSCAARFALPSEHQSLCFPRSAWQAWLSDRSGGDCATLRGQWRLGAFRQNSPGEPKVTTRTLVVREFSRPRGTRWLDHWERARADLSQTLTQAGDRHGSLRALVLSERPRGDEADWLRTLGWVHAFGVAGVHLLSRNGGPSQ